MTGFHLDESLLGYGPKKKCGRDAEGRGKVMGCQCLLLTPPLAQRFGSISEIPADLPPEESVSASPP